MKTNTDRSKHYSVLIGKFEQIQCELFVPRLKLVGRFNQCTDKSKFNKKLHTLDILYRD